MKLQEYKKDADLIPADCVVGRVEGITLTENIVNFIKNNDEFALELVISYVKENM